MHVLFKISFKLARVNAAEAALGYTNLVFTEPRQESSNTNRSGTPLAWLAPASDSGVLAPAILLVAVPLSPGSASLCCKT